MKKIILFLFLIFIQFVTAQQYQFDYIIITEEHRLKPYEKEPYISQKAINSQDNSYELYISTSGQASIWDVKNNFRHYYLITENEKKQLIFTYLETYQFIPETEFYIDVQKTGENSYIIKNFTNQKKKRSETEIEVTLENAPANLITFNADVGGYLRRAFANELRKAIIDNNNYIITESKIKYKSGYKFQKKLISYNKIQPIIVETPKKLIFKT